MGELHRRAAVLGRLEPPVDRRADPAGEAPDWGPLDAPAGLECADAELERLGPVGPEAEAGDAARLVGDLQLVGPVAGESLLGGERFEDGVGPASTVVRKWMAGMTVSLSGGVEPRVAAGRVARGGATEALEVVGPALLV